MKNLTKTLVAIVVAAAGILSLPQVEAVTGPILKNHPVADAVVAAVLFIAALVHNPKKSS